MNENYIKKDILTLFSNFSCGNNKVPSISFDDYVDRIIKYTKISKASLILSGFYIRQIKRNFSYLEIDELNEHRLICCAILVSIIHLEDDLVCYHKYARICGITKCELDKLVMIFLKLIDYRLFMFDDLLRKILLKV